MTYHAIVYRRQDGFPHDWGKAANICSMVFGNMGDDCGTGVAFTRDPATGENIFYGEYLINAQGEDVVAGIRTPNKIAELQKDMPDVYPQLLDVRAKLEKHYRDVQDIEFTIQNRKLWMLQTRNGKRTGFAGVRFAVDMVEEGLITKNEAMSAGRIPPDDLNQLLQPIFDADAKRKAQHEGKVLAKGINAGAKTLNEGDFISIDGFTGEVMEGQIATKPSEVVQVLINKTMKPEQSRVYQQFAQLMSWADEARGNFKIRTNADEPEQAAAAI